MKTLKIVKIEKIKNSSKRYDIETKNTHNFFANGILVHNSNFSIWYDGETIQYAKRTTFIGDLSNFFNWQEAVERGDFDKKIIELYRLSNAQKNIILYGELCGGNYPHPDIPKSNEKAVQKCIYYHSKEQFVPFDLKVDNIYMSASSFALNMKKMDIIVAPLLFEGTMTECLAYPNDEQSVLYKEFGLPQLEDNIMEGVVIKPIETLYMGHTRIIIKNKNSKYSEKDKVKKISAPIVFSNEGKKFLEELSKYMNENRIKSVISKLGIITQKDFSKLMGLVSGDCVKDFIKDCPEFVDFSKSSRKKITNYFMKNVVAAMIRKNFLNIIDGNF